MLPRFISGVPKFLQAPTISRKGAGPDLYCDVGQLLAKNPVQNETTAAGKRRSWLDTNARAAGQKSEHQATRHDSQLYSADTRETHTQKKKERQQQDNCNFCVIKHSVKQTQLKLSQEISLRQRDHHGVTHAHAQSHFRPHTVHMFSHGCHHFCTPVSTVH